MSLLGGVRRYFSSTPEREQEAVHGEEKIGKPTGIDCGECGDGEMHMVPTNTTGAASEGANANANAGLEQIGAGGGQQQSFEHSTDWSTVMTCDNCNNQIGVDEPTSQQQSADAGGAEVADNETAEPEASSDAEAGAGRTESDTDADLEREHEGEVETSKDLDAGAGGL